MTGSSECFGMRSYPRLANRRSPLLLEAQLPRGRGCSGSRLSSWGSVTDAAGSGRSTEMDVTMIGLQNAGKTSLLRVLAVSDCMV